MTVRMILGGAMVIAAMYTVELIGRRADMSGAESPGGGAPSRGLTGGALNRSLPL
jgi:hypothetical protein